MISGLFCVGETNAMQRVNPQTIDQIVEVIQALELKQGDQEANHIIKDAVESEKHVRVNDDEIAEAWEKIDSIKKKKSNEPVQQKKLQKDEFLKELDKSLKTLPQLSDVPQEQQKVLSKEELSQRLKRVLKTLPQGTSTPEGQQEQTLLPPSNFQGILLPLSDFPNFADRSSYVSFDTNMIVRVTKSNNPEIKVGDLVHFDPELAQLNSKPLSLRQLKQATLGQTIAFDAVSKPMALVSGKAKIGDVKKVKGFAQREILSDDELLKRIKERSLPQGISTHKSYSEQKIPTERKMIERIPQQERETVSNKTGQSSQEKTQIISEQKQTRELTPDEMSREADIFLTALGRDNPDLKLDQRNVDNFKFWLRKGELHLDRKELKIIPSEIGIFLNLKAIDISSNQLSGLPDEIGNLKQLQTIHLSNNSLTELPRVIENLKQLKSLNLSNNQLTRLPVEIGNLVQLQYFDLSNNQLTELPDNIGNLTQLLRFKSNNNQLTRLPSKIGNLAQLQDFNLSNNQLTELPDEIGNLNQLEKFELNDNQLIVLPDEIGNLKKLDRLELENNQITKLPNGIGGLLNLTYLKLENNQLIVLPIEIGNLVQLRYFDLGNNQLKELPDDIENLTMLNGLVLRNNKLTGLPSGIRKLLKLKSLYSDSPPHGASEKYKQKLYRRWSIDLTDNPILPHGENETIWGRWELLKNLGDTVKISHIPGEIHPIMMEENIGPNIARASCPLVSNIKKAILSGENGVKGLGEGKYKLRGSPKLEEKDDIIFKYLIVNESGGAFCEYKNQTNKDDISIEINHIGQSDSSTPIVDGFDKLDYTYDMKERVYNQYKAQYPEQMSIVWTLKK